MNWSLIKTVLKARRNGLLHLVPATEPVSLDCLAAECARCCRLLGMPVVTPDEAEKIGYQWILKSEQGMIVKSDESGCCLLKEGLCSVYADRPKGCREYPWYNIDGKLYYDAGCPGMKYDKDGRPDVNDIQSFENFFPGTPKLVLWLVRKICVKSADHSRIF